MSRRRVRKYRVRRVILIERFKDNYLLGGIDRCHHSGDHSLGRKARDRDTDCRIEVDTMKQQRIVGHRTVLVLDTAADVRLVTERGRSCID